MRNALENKPLSGWAKITHPFHPYQGQRYPVLKIRWVSGIEMLSLHGSPQGTFAVPREWTDWALPDAASHPESILHPIGLLSLVELTQKIDSRQMQKGVDR